MLRINFHADPDIWQWYKSLPDGARARKLNSLLRWALEVSAQTDDLESGAAAIEQRLAALAEQQHLLKDRIETLELVNRIAASARSTSGPLAGFTVNHIASEPSGSPYDALVAALANTALKRANSYEDFVAALANTRSTQQPKSLGHIIARKADSTDEISRKIEEQLRKYRERSKDSKP